MSFKICYDVELTYEFYMLHIFFVSYKKPTFKNVNLQVNY